MWKTVEQYMTQPKADRQSHLVLDEPCVEIGGNSVTFKGLLAHFLGTTIPEPRVRSEKGSRIHLCHACNNGKCSNVRHLYWGTSKENLEDTGLSFWDRLVSKYGYDRACEMNRERMIGNRNAVKSLS